MPSVDKIKELLDNCTSEWAIINKVDGRKFTSKINGGSIFLPAAGCRRGGDLEEINCSGDYWSSTQYPEDQNGAYNLYFYQNDANWSFDGDRCSGHTVRPVWVP